MSAHDHPLEETRGGRNIDWANAKPGQPLEELPGTEITQEIDESLEDLSTGTSRSRP